MKAAGAKARQQMQCKNSFANLDSDDEEEDEGVDALAAAASLWPKISDREAATGLHGSWKKKPEIVKER